MATAQAKQTVFRKQPAMRKVVLAALPCVAGAVYYFGWRSLVMVLFCCGWGFLLEWLFCRSRREPVSEAVFVTAILFALIMPPAVGWHVLAVGMAFAIIFTKEAFGGFGRNIFNPAMAGRCFVYICFPVALTGIWYPPAQGPMGALTQWTSARQSDGTIAVTGATPMAYLKAGQLVLETETTPQTAETIPFEMNKDQTIGIGRMTLLKGVLFGRTSGTMGVTSAVLILIGGIYLFWTKTASRNIILSVIIAYAVFTQILYWCDVSPVPPAWAAVLGNGFLFGAFFMATDPISAPRTEPAKIFYGILIAVAVVVIRNFSIFNGGLMFAILLGNMFAPIIDYGVKTLQDRRKAGHPAKEAAA
jgi:Na+-transporting NADH:ubiquinone oxidoreductase subunit B